jgi:hypothetical protein
MSVQQGPLLDATLDPANGNHRSNYSPSFSLSSRSQLGLDIPVQTLSNTRLPPPPTQGGQVFFSASDRYPPQDPSHGPTYSSGGMPIDGGHQASSSSGQAVQGSSTSNNATPSQEQPRKESSGVVIACRQWCVPISSPPALLLTEFAVGLVKFAAIQLDLCAIIAFVDPTNASTMQLQNVVALTSDLVLVRGPAKRGQLTGRPRHHRRSANAQGLRRELTTGHPRLVLRKTWQV